jgi:hypothetical protein
MYIYSTYICKYRYMLDQCRGSSHSFADLDPTFQFDMEPVWVPDYTALSSNAQLYLATPALELLLASTYFCVVRGHMCKE